MSRTTVLHADESFVNPTTRNYLVVAITENEAGYSIVSEWPTLEKAKDQAAVYNAHLGFTEDEIRDIRFSSLRARVHKAAPGSDDAHCDVCGQRIKRVQGGQGPTYVHADSGAVAAPNPPRHDASSHWAEDNDFSVADWQYEVANGDTRQGYADWVVSQREGRGGN